MDKYIALKKIKRKFRNEKEFFKNLYKNTHRTYKFLKDIAEPCHLKPAKGKLREYQLNILNFSNEWFKTFEKIDISYFLISGNLLGAYRNKGFIPWDDDFDIGMMRNDWNRLIAYLKENYAEIDVSEISYSANNRSEILEKHIKKYPDKMSFAIFPTHLQILKGSDMKSLNTLDIHPYDYYSEDFSLEDLKKLSLKIKNAKKDLDNFKKVNEFLAKERLENPNIVEHSNKIYSGVDNFDITFLSVTDFYTENDIFPLKKLPFEDTELCVMNNPEKSLLINYGKDYMNMPEKIYVNSHINYRIKPVKEVKQKKSISLEKQILLKKLKRKYFCNQTEFFKDLYKKYKSYTTPIIEAIDVKNVKPCQEKFLREYQLATTDFAKKITDFFDEHNLEYFITSGTLIGAVRHQGFVPWDDDFDIGMMRKDYEKLKEILKQKFKIIDLSNIKETNNNKSDIMNKVLLKSNNEICCFIGTKLIQIVQGKSLYNCMRVDVFSHEYYKEGYTLKEHEKYMQKIKQKLSEMKNFKDAVEFLDNDIKNNPNVVDKSSFIYYGVDSLGSYIVKPTGPMSQDMIFPRKKVKFENYEFYAPNNPDGYIKVQYPDYWNLPSNFCISPDLEIKSKYKIKE